MFFAWLELEVSGTSHWRNNSRNLSFSVSQLKATLAPHQLRALGEKVGGGGPGSYYFNPVRSKASSPHPIHGRYIVEKARLRVNKKCKKWRERCHSCPSKKEKIDRVSKSFELGRTVVVILLDITHMLI